MSNVRRRVCGALAVMVAAGMFSSCSVFQSSRKMDMSPFSQNVITLFNEATKVSSPYPWVELKKYKSVPELRELQTQAQPVIAGLKGLILYSNQLVALNSSQLTEAEKNMYLAEYLAAASTRAMERGRFESLGIRPDALDTILANVRKAPTFMDGIAAASPFVDAIVISMSNRLDQISDMAPLAVAAMDREIDQDQGDQRRNYQELRELQARGHQAFTLLLRAKLGDHHALDSLLLVDPSLVEYVPAGGTRMKINWAGAEDELTRRLSRIHECFGQLDLERKQYTAKQAELEDWYTQLNLKVKIARDALIVWAQSHQNLGRGIPVPPIIDVESLGLGLAKKVVPLP